MDKQECKEQMGALIEESNHLKKQIERAMKLLTTYDRSSIQSMGMSIYGAHQILKEALGENN